MFSTTRKALTAAAVAVALVAAISSPSIADKKDDLEKHKRDVSGKIGDAQQNLEQSSKAYANAAATLKRAQAKLDAAQSALSATRGALATARAMDVQMQAKLAASQAALAAAVAKLDQGEAELADSEARVQEFTVQNLQLGDRGMRAFGDLLSGEDPSTFSEQVTLNNAVSDDQIASMQKLAATRVILKLKRDSVRTLRDQVKSQREQAAANLVKKQKLEAAALSQAVEVAKLVSGRRSAAAVAAKARNADKQVLQSLESERKRLEAQIRALTPKQVKDAGGDGGGTLSYPANGPITSPYGMRFHPILHVWKLHDGTDFGVPCGTPVHAAAGGRILQTYYNAGYGNRIILNNGIMRGKGVVTTYNHLTRWIVNPGQHVTRGQLIGYSGTTGYSTGCHLHFMVIVNGATVNPMGWL
jgi:murein DD-endopeptidase MepM/ murein hydrolase activator NlpD